MPVSRFTQLAGIPERSYRRRSARQRAGDRVKGPWPAPKLDAVEALAAKYAADWPAWGHRKIAAMMRADGKTFAAIRRRVFRDPPTERNRVWQSDFSEFETCSGGIWRIEDRTLSVFGTAGRRRPSRARIAGRTKISP